MNERCNLLRRLQEEDFAVYETVLFLDGHPDDKKALEYYNSHRDTAIRLREEYAKHYGPLTIYDGEGRTWNWTDAPFPWEKEAN